MFESGDVEGLGLPELGHLQLSRAQGLRKFLIFQDDWIDPSAVCQWSVPKPTATATAAETAAEEMSLVGQVHAAAVEVAALVSRGVLELSSLELSWEQHPGVDPTRPEFPPCWDRVVAALAPLRDVGVGVSVVQPHLRRCCREMEGDSDDGGSEWGDEEDYDSHEEEDSGSHEEDYDSHEEEDWEED